MENIIIFYFAFQFVTRTCHLYDYGYRRFRRRKQSKVNKKSVLIVVRVGVLPR